MNNKRIIVFYVVFSLCLMGGSFRLFNLQVLKNDHYSSISYRQSIKRKLFYPKRGEIWDRNCRPLVVNAKVDFTFDENSKKKKLLKRVALQHFLASQVLGSVGYKGQGQFGIEYHQDNVLKGTNGWKYYRLNVFRKMSPSLKDQELKPIHGKNIITTLDVEIQEITESALKWGVERTQAIDGVAIIMDPHTGEILSLANYPFYHLNRKNFEDMKYWKNQAISKSYEPGSTMKIFTTAIALEEGLTRIDEKFNGENGQYLTNGFVVNDTKRNQEISLSQAMAYSSNIVMVKLSNRINSSVFYRYLRSFGFGNKTGIKLPAEELGTLKEINQWSTRSKMTISWGQEIVVTPLQILTASSVIANGGFLIQPQIIKGYVDEDNNIQEFNFPVKVRKVIREETAAQVRKLLTGVVEYGTAKSIHNLQYSIAGKTGTVEKIDPETGNYVEGKFHSSFIGMVPADNPKYIGIILLNEPKLHKYGGISAAPIFKKIMDQVLKKPRYTLTKKKHSKKKVIKNKKVVNLAKIDFSYDKYSKKVFLQDNDDKKVFMMPNLKGLTLKQTIQRIAPFNKKISYTGHGFVQSQSPNPNKILDSNSNLKIILGY